MKTYHVQAVVIGAGTAGLAAYRGIQAGGKSVLLIESGVGGTTCARVGCMPSKLLIAAAESVHAVEQSHHFGIHGKVQSINGFEVMDRVRRERDRFVGFVQKGVSNIPSENRLLGFASFLDAHTLIVKDGAHEHRVSFEQAVIATGSSPTYPLAWKSLGDRLILNDDVFAWKTLPSSVAVFGPGVIGLELGQALHRLGVKVKIFGRGGSLGPIRDPKIASVARDIFNNELYVNTDAQTHVQLAKGGRFVEVQYDHHDGTSHTEQFDYLLAATGRAPNVRNMGLEQFIPESQWYQGVPVFDPLTLQLLHAPHIFMAGDVNGVFPLLHEAADEGAFVAKNVLSYPKTHSIQRRASLGIVFTDPQIAIVGSGYDSTCSENIVIGSVDYSDQGRSRIMLKNKGWLNVYVDRTTRKFLGAEMIGPGAEHIGHLLAWSLQSGLTVDQMLEMVFYHPVIEEGVRTALRDAKAKLDV